MVWRISVDRLFSHVCLPGRSDAVSPVASSSPCLLLVTGTYLRLYAPSSIIASIRAPLHKISFPGRIAWALPVTYTTSQDADEVAESGLIVLAYDGTVHLFSLPSLDIIGTANIDDIVRFPLFKKNEHEEGSLTHLKLFEGDGEGNVYVCGQNGELVHFNCFDSVDAMTPIGSPASMRLYDWDLAHAAHAASQLTQAGATNANVSITEGM